VSISLTSRRVGLLCGAVVVLLVAGCATPGGNASSAGCGDESPKTLVIRWQRLVDIKGDTCGRCGDTERSLDEARRLLARSLKPLDIRAELVKTRLTLEQFKRAPSESNRIWIGDATLDEILGAKAGDSRCCGACGDSNCRTLIIDGRTYETIPSQLIVRAGLRVAANLVQPAPPPSGCCPSDDASSGADTLDLQPMPWLSR
jgi:hypothetical protein